MSLPLFFEDYQGPLPLFPLPNVVFFPHTFLPLHIFEPRYRQMVKEAVEKDGLIGMVLLKSGWEADYKGNPPIHSIACLGQIVKMESYPDGRSNILLHGLSRIRIERIDNIKPYRQAKIELIDEDPAELSPRKESWLRRELFEAFGRVVEPPYWGFSVLAAPHLSLGILADLIVSSFPFEPLEKQKILETLSSEERIHKLAKILEREEEQGKRVRVKQLPFLHELARN